MPKHKPVDTALRDWGEANLALAEIGDIQRNINIITTEAEQHIASIRTQMDVQLAPFNKRRKAVEASLEQFAIHNKADFGKARSRRLVFGVIGWRKGTGKLKLLRGWSWKKVVEKLDALGYRKYLRLNPKADKEALEKDHRSGELAAERLARFGLKWSVEDEFYYELKREDTTD